MTIDVVGPGGTSVSFPDGTDSATISAVMAKNFGGGDTPAPEASSVSTNDVVRSAARGVPLIGGLLNKINAAGNAALAPVVEPFLEKGPDTLDQPTFGERYAKSLAIQDAMDKKFSTEHPIVDTAAGLAGGIWAGGALLKAAPAVASAALGLGGKTLPQQMLRGAISGTAIGGADSAIRGEDPTQGAGIGAITGAAGPVVGRGVGKVVEGVHNLVVPEPKLLNAEGVSNAADAGYAAVRNSGVELKPSGIASVAKDNEQELMRDGLRDYLAPKTFNLLSELQNHAPGSTVTFADIHGIRRVLGSIAGSLDPTEKMAATRAIKALDGYLEAIPPADVLKGDAQGASKIFQQANANYAALKHGDILQGKLDAADLQAASANSGANIDNATRQRIRDILNSPKLRRGFTQDEILQMQKIVRGTSLANMVRATGNLMGGGGGLGALVTGGAASLAAGPMGLAAPLAGYATKKIGNAMTQRQVRKLDEMIRSRAPANEAIANEIAAARAASQARLTTAGNIGSLAGRAAEPIFGSLFAPR
jgi:hypothetical protein